MNSRDLGRRCFGAAALLAMQARIAQERVAEGRTEIGPISGAAPAAPTRPPVAFKPAVGRNDPCPCGSGKKYKKCHRP